MGHPPHHLPKQSQNLSDKSSLRVMEPRTLEGVCLGSSMPCMPPDMSGVFPEKPITSNPQPMRTASMLQSRSQQDIAVLALKANPCPDPNPDSGQNPHPKA